MLALRLKTTDLQALDAELQHFYGDKPDFFDGDSVAVDLSSLPTEQQHADLDFAALAQVLQAHNLCLMAASDGSVEHMAAARQLGLAVGNDIFSRPAAAKRQVANQDPAGAAGAAPMPPGALVLEHPVRSGQQVYARGRDLVVLAQVNAGAEVIADGHIHVYAALRGRAIAGARGWSDARIFAAMMQPQLVSIAGIYQTSDEPLPPHVWQAAAFVSLRSDEAGNKLVFQPLSR